MQSLEDEDDVVVFCDHYHHWSQKMTGNKKQTIHKDAKYSTTFWNNPGIFVQHRLFTCIIEAYVLAINRSVNNNKNKYNISSNSFPRYHKSQTK